MKKITKKKLALTKQSVRVLIGNDLANVAGGWVKPPLSWTCTNTCEDSYCKC